MSPEIEIAFERLSPAEQQKIMRQFMTIETPAMIAALDEGIRSAETEPMIPLNDVRKKIKLWASK